MAALPGPLNARRQLRLLVHTIQMRLLQRLPPSRRRSGRRHRRPPRVKERSFFRVQQVPPGLTGQTMPPPLARSSGNMEMAVIAARARAPEMRGVALALIGAMAGAADTAQSRCCRGSLLNVVPDRHGVQCMTMTAGRPSTMQPVCGPIGVLAPRHGPAVSRQRFIPFRCGSCYQASSGLDVFMEDAHQN